MIEYYKNPQGLLMKTQYVKWEKTSMNSFIQLIQSNSMDKNYYLNNLAKQCLSAYSIKNKIKLGNVTKLLYDVVSAEQISEDSFFFKINFHFPAKGYEGLVWDENWTLLWIEKVAHKLAKDITFDEYIKGFEARYPQGLFLKMKEMWNNYR